MRNLCLDSHRTKGWFLHRFPAKEPMNICTNWGPAYAHYAPFNTDNKKTKDEITVYIYIYIWYLWYYMHIYIIHYVYIIQYVYREYQPKQTIGVTLYHTVNGSENGAYPRMATVPENCPKAVDLEEPQMNQIESTRQKNLPNSTVKWLPWGKTNIDVGKWHIYRWFMITYQKWGDRLVM